MTTNELDHSSANKLAASMRSHKGIEGFVVASMNSDAMYSMEKLGISKEELNLIKRQLRKPHTASWNRCDGNSYKVMHANEMYVSASTHTSAGPRNLVATRTDNIITVAVTPVSGGVTQVLDSMSALTRSVRYDERKINFKEQKHKQRYARPGTGTAAECMPKANLGSTSHTETFY
mmetsp:Transcript_2571/g.5143  ORF Transcript_2571/g.5143 Transcript_2571/m.5143 type:complete len:176 (-) Transcript_2571:126-653(-)